ncbi:hypothetical protein [Streptomyces sp. NWU49]|nr:hypothetical protein [Streptomyces sp. NWU49]
MQQHFERFVQLVGGRERWVVFTLPAQVSGLSLMVCMSLASMP